MSDIGPSDGLTVHTGAGTEPSAVDASTGPIEGADDPALGRTAHDVARHQLLVRRHVAERLHDGPVQVLTAAALRLGLLRTRAPSELADELAEIERLVSQSLRDVRGEMEALRDPTDPGPTT